MNKKKWNIIKSRLFKSIFYLGLFLIFRGFLVFKISAAGWTKFHVTMRKIDYRVRRSMYVVCTGYPVRFAWFQSRNTLTSRYIEARIKKTDALCGRMYSSAIDSILCFPAFRADMPSFARWTKNNKQSKTHHHL